MCHQIEGRLSSPSRSTDGNVEMVLRKSIVDLVKSREEPLVRFLHLILDKLILLLVRPPVISGTVGMLQLSKKILCNNFPYTDIHKITFYLSILDF